MSFPQRQQAPERVSKFRVEPNVELLRFDFKALQPVPPLEPTKRKESLLDSLRRWMEEKL